MSKFMNSDGHKKSKNEGGKRGRVIEKLAYHMLKYSTWLGVIYVVKKGKSAAQVGTSRVWLENSG